MPRRRRGGGAPWRSIRASSATCAEAHEVGRTLLRVNPTFSAGKFVAGHAFKDADKRRLFGEHLVLAGLPE